LVDAYDEEPERVVLRFHPQLAPIKVAVFPLMRKDEMVAKAKAIEKMLRPHFMVDYDETANIGKRYRRQDEIGTPWCVTVDPDTLQDDTVTLRERDSMAQVRLPISGLVSTIHERLWGVR
jgi:glycyl-tRNA synthetase